MQRQTCSYPYEYDVMQHDRGELSLSQFRLQWFLLGGSALYGRLYLQAEVVRNDLR